MKILSGVQVTLTGGDVSRAEKYLERHYKGKQGLDCYLKLIQARHYQGLGNIPDTNTARRLAEEAIAMCPENPGGYVMLGFVYHSDYWLGNTTSRRETLEKGIELAKKAIAMDDSWAQSHGLLSMCYRHKGEISESLAEGERAIALNPNDPIILENYGNSLLFAGRSEEAIPIFQKAIRIDPFFGFGHMGYGSALRLSGRFEEASSAYRKAMQFQPDNFLIRVYLAITYIMTDREKEAREEAAEVLRINPKYPDDFVAKNPAYKNQTESDKIDNVLRKGMAFYLFNYGNNLIFAGRTEEAIPIFEKLIRLNPFGPWYLYSQFGVALRNAERFGEAVAEHRKAIQLGPDEVSPRVNLAVTYILMGREREAQAEATKVIRMNPKFTVDSWAKTFVYKDQSQQDKIVNAAQKAGLK